MRAVLLVIGMLFRAIKSFREEDSVSASRVTTRGVSIVCLTRVCFVFRYLFCGKPVEQVSVGAGDRPGGGLPVTRLRVPVFGAPGRAAAARTGASALGPAQHTSPASYGPERAKAWSLRGSVRGTHSLYTSDVGVRIRVARRMAGSPHAVR